MLYFKLSVFSFLLCFKAVSADLHDKSFESQLEALSQVPCASQVRERVLADLAEWGPQHTSAYMHYPLWFRDAYMENEALRSVVDAYFVSSFTQNCYETFVGERLNCPLDAMAHASEIGMELWRLAKMLPYLWYSEERAAMLANFSWRDSAISGAALLSHWSAVVGYTCGGNQGMHVGDPVSWLAALLTEQVFKITSITLAAGAAYLALKGEFIDVALRYLKHKYERQHRLEEVAAVSAMIAYRNNATSASLRRAR